MNDNINKTPKIKITDIFREVISLYKENYRLFVKITLIIFLLALASSVITVLQYAFKDPGFLILYKLLLIPIMIPFIYYNIEFSIALFITISERYKKGDINVKDAIKRALLKFWRYVGVNLRFFLILLFPIAGGIITYFFITAIILKYLLIGVFTLLTIYLGTLYGFAPLISVIGKEKNNFFATSKKLVQGDFLRIAFLMVGVMLAFAMPYFLYLYVFNDYNAISHINKFVASLINQILYIFITPLLSSISVVTYYTLLRNKNVN